MNSYSQNPLISPYNLLPCEFEVYKLISLELTESNYHIWSRSFLNALEARNKQGFIDGTIPTPEAIDSIYPLWKQTDCLVKTWISNCISPQILASISIWKTAKEVWLDLKVRYSPVNNIRRFEIFRELWNIKQRNLSVTDYYAKIKALWDELEYYEELPTCKCGNCSCDLLKVLLVKREEERLMQFLMGLNDTFSHISYEILLMSPFPDANKGFNIILQEERKQYYKQRKGH